MCSRPCVVLAPLLYCWPTEKTAKSSHPSICHFFFFNFFSPDLLAWLMAVRCLSSFPAVSGTRRSGPVVHVLRSCSAPWTSCNSPDGWRRCSILCPAPHTSSSSCTCWLSIANVALPVFPGQERDTYIVQHHPPSETGRPVASIWHTPGDNSSWPRRPALGLDRQSPVCRARTVAHTLSFLSFLTVLPFPCCRWRRATRTVGRPARRDRPHTDYERVGLTLFTESVNYSTVFFCRVPTPQSDPCENLEPLFQATFQFSTRDIVSR